MVTRVLPCPVTNGYTSDPTMAGMLVAHGSAGAKGCKPVGDMVVAKKRRGSTMRKRQELDKRRWLYAIGAAGAAMAVMSAITACGGGGGDSDVVLEPVAACDFEIGAVPFVAAQPGQYCLVADLDATSVAQDAIVIEADGVTIDGAGHWLQGPDAPETPYRGVIAYDQGQLRIENLSVKGFHTAILIARTDASDADGRYPNARSKNVQIDNVHVQDQRLQGIHVRADEATVTDATVRNVGGSTATPHAFATGIYLTGNGCSISGNDVEGLHAVGSGEGVGIALYGGIDCQVRDNRIVFSDVPAWSENYGLWISTGGNEPPLVEANEIVGASYVAGPFGRYKDNTATNVVCDLFVRRFTLGVPLIDEGRNLVASHATGVQCKNDPEVMARLFLESESPEAAYAVARAWTEVNAGLLVDGGDPANAALQTYVWLRVAARLGHALAVGAVETGWSGYAPDFYEAANAEVASILGQVV